MLLRESDGVFKKLVQVRLHIFHHQTDLGQVNMPILLKSDLLIASSASGSAMGGG